MKLSENFSLAEFTRNGRGLENVPNAAQINSMMELCDNLLELVLVDFENPEIVDRQAKLSTKINNDAIQRRCG